ncbi:MAG: hypothetical protein F4Z25_12850 [Chloroflexi bacterium]|nr:hypothetical protein [Chloroflexota bacterium]
MGHRPASPSSECVRAGRRVASGAGRGAGSRHARRRPRARSRAARPRRRAAGPRPRSRTRSPSCCCPGHRPSADARATTRPSCAASPAAARRRGSRGRRAA